LKPPVIIGGGHNGLVTAFYLARAGHKPIVLERRSVVGGCAVTGEIGPGYRCPTLAHATGPLRESIARDMRLARRVEFVEGDPRLVALSADGRALRFFRDRARTAEAIRPFSESDASHYGSFCDALEKLGGFLAPLLEVTPPSLDGPAAGEVWDLLKTGRRFRALGRTDGYRLLRWMPMAVADLVGEFFSTDLAQAAIAARGIFGTAAGPWSAGTGATLLLAAAVDPAPGGSSVTVKGGPGALTKAMADAAREAGAEIRVGAAVAKVLVKDGAAAGVALTDGTEIASATVISNADPGRTLLDLVDPVELDPVFLTRMRNYRSLGTVAKVNLALSGLPAFTGVDGPADLHGRIHIGPSIDYLERAFDHSKYGEMSREPYLEATLPSLADPSLAPPGRHVMSVYVQFAPYRLAGNGGWDGARQSLGDLVVETLERYAPGLKALVERRQVVTPADLEQEFGLTGGHIFHGEPALDQLFTMRPVLGWARYRTPVKGLYLCGAGTHPGGGIGGAPGHNAAREILEDLRR
jgi:phytoene dehydrogenase-like protein